MFSINNGGKTMNGSRLKDKIALVTGGARGIGFGIMEKFAQEGARVVAADILDDGADRTAKIGDSAEFYYINLRNREDIFVMAKYIHDKYGKIDILVNCAGIARPCPTLKLSETMLDEVIDINMKAPLFCCQAVGRYMRKEGGGSIVNISSGNTKMINVGRVPYGITKGAVNMLTRHLGAEWGIYNIKVNAIAPGWIRTEMVERPLKLGILDEKEIMSVSPIGRFGSVEEIASLACFLACDESNYITGQIIFADGGWNTGIMPNALDYIRENDTEEE
jgi:NAD(P)-dependent dehydrogenase (short-subunit alcohol dehydrogenase family)